MNQHRPQLTVKTIAAPAGKQLDTLRSTVDALSGQPGIIFCNFKESLHEVSDFLFDHAIEHECFYGGLEQIDRERALVKFRNGTCQLLLATDLAARGLDIPEIKFIIHFELPYHSNEFTHRNGRTARMNAEGAAYVLHTEGKRLPDFIKSSQPEPQSLDQLHAAKIPPADAWSTLYITAGRQDKVSKGDIAGMFFKTGGLNKDELGIIELQQNCYFVAVKRTIAHRIIERTNNQRLKKKKVRVTLVR